MSDSGKKSKIEKLYLFRSALFWDADIAMLDPETHARYIIGRVITRGDMSDWNTLKELYGHQRIRKEVIHLRSLDAKSLSFLSCYYNIGRTLFRCCTSTLSSRKL
ncbi:MAG: hypothetical protein WBM35_14970 [Candidatus Electrothrix sp.]